MARIVQEIKIELCHKRALEALSRAVDFWPQEKIDQFAKEWEMMEIAGAELADVQFVGGRVVAYPSEDFTKHLAAYGVYP